MVRRGSRLGRQIARCTERVRGGQHGAMVDGPVVEYRDSVLVLEGSSETQGERATTETRWKLYLPRGLAETVASSVWTVTPGPVDGQGQPLRLAAAGPPQPQFKRNGRFSHTELPLRHATG